MIFPYRITESSEKIKRLNEWNRGKNAKPYKMIIFPTYACNLNCSYCPFSVSRKSEKYKNLRELSKEQWLKIVKQGINNGIKEWMIFGGGEPMMRSEITMGIIMFVKAHDIDSNCEIITNGTLFTKEIIEELVRKRLNRIIFSVDGPSANIHDSLRRTPGAFKRTIEAIKIFSEMKKMYNSTKPEIKVNMVINKLNYNKIEKMLELMAFVGCNELALHPMRTYEKNDIINKLSLDSPMKASMSKHIRNAEKIAAKYGLKLNADMIELSKGRNEEKNVVKNDFISSLCFEPFYTIFVDPAGNTAPCNGQGEGYTNYNITKMSLEDIWFSDLFESTRKMMIDKRPMESCSKCGLTDMTEHLRKDLME